MSVRALSIRTVAGGVRSDADIRFTILRFPVFPCGVSCTTQPFPCYF